jgi:hypothetical protein
VQSKPQLTVSCKVCDQGILIHKRIYRMSAPVVAIGYILLVPSLLGIATCVLLLLGVISYNDHATNPYDKIVRQPLNAEDAFRVACINGSRQEPIFTEKQGRLECECVLQAIQGQKGTPEENQNELRDVTAKLNQGILDRQNTKLTAATLFCAEHLNSSSTLTDSGKYIYDRLEAPEDTENKVNVSTRLVHIVGEGWSVFWLIASFIAGLLGWLLVMKKKVLKCNVCGAIINAS